MVKKTESSTGPPKGVRKDGLPKGGQRLIKKTESSTGPPSGVRKVGLPKGVRKEDNHQTLSTRGSRPPRVIGKEHTVLSSIYMFLNTYIFYNVIITYINLGTRN
jgi:hypothetical protein